MSFNTKFTNQIEKQCIETKLTAHGLLCNCAARLLQNSQEKLTTSLPEQSTKCVWVMIVFEQRILNISITAQHTIVMNRTIVSRTQKY